MNIVESTRLFERWMGSHFPIVRADLAFKHEYMEESAFVFLRGTFYRWVQRWPSVCPTIVDAPIVPSVGDLHIENFGTWRDTEGRLVWGVNDVDEACLLPYTNDLVRLATSATLAAREGHLELTARDACDAIIEGYIGSLEADGAPMVLEEKRRWLRRIAVQKLRDPNAFWERFDHLKPARGGVPQGILRAAMPDKNVPYRVVKRVAGVGSLGRPRFAALANWRGSRIAREAKAWLPSAAVWVTGRTSAGVSGARLLDRARRSPDPFLNIGAGWIVRRLAPDCSRIELSDLPALRDERRLMLAMGWETANIHVPSKRQRILADLARRPRRWLERAAVDMADSVETDWKRWLKR